MKISRDLDTNKEHTHNIGQNDRRYPCSGIRDFHTLGSVSIQGQVHQHNADPTQHEHEPGRQTLDYVLPVDPALKEDDGSDRTREAVLGRSDAWRLDNDIVDDSGDDHEVGEENEGVDGHGGGEGEGWELESESRRAEEAVGEDPNEEEKRVDGGGGWVVGGGGCGGGWGLGFGFWGHFGWVGFRFWWGVAVWSVGE